MSLLDLHALKQANSAYERILKAIQDENVVSHLPDALQEAIKSGVIQHFEFTYELAWKFIKRWLEKNYSSSYVDGCTRRELFRLAAENQLIDSVDAWMIFHQARNQTSHTYDKAVAETVYEHAIHFLAEAKELAQRLEAKND